jgi:hypothetical protein
MSFYCKIGPDGYTISPGPYKSISLKQQYFNIGVLIKNVKTIPLKHGSGPEFDKKNLDI